ncbi:MAG: DegT/DnrJ/EryC1/StrS family aminotransferase [Spirochaetaceae bacterium]|nr:MAG: DegT/DnrJ/EryC1/StrS family aminotransferase [Spirochaetaceae bacterium]
MDTPKQENIEFVDLAAQLEQIKPQMQQAIWEVVESTAFIRGPQVDRLEQKLGDYVGVQAIGCASGTDALMIALMALDVKPGDQIIIPDFTFIATGEVVSLLGAVPVFCDVDPVTYNMDPQILESLINEKTVGIIPVSIFGQCADFDAINAIAGTHSLWVMEDGAQSFGAEYKGQKSCSMTTVATTSFFPAKPLGCYGDGGAVFTADNQLADKIRMILNHGQSQRYVHSLIGVNARLDTIQAAVLLAKLPIFDQEMERRRWVASEYTRLLGQAEAAAEDGGGFTLPQVASFNTSVWAQYTLQHDKRDVIREKLQEKGIPTSVHYPVPLHKQPAFGYLGAQPDCPVTSALSDRVFSIPMHPYLTEKQIERVATAVLEAVR